MNHFIRNQQGVTVIELLGALVIFSIVLTVIFSFFTTGSNAFQKGETDISLQNEANLLLTEITVAFYSENEFTLSFNDDNGDGLNDIVLNGEVLSDDRFLYEMAPESINTNEQLTSLVLTVINPLDMSDRVVLKTMLRSVHSYEKSAE